jgi:hypothetical protein
MMKKRQFLIPVMAGMIVGQIFAEGDRPFTVVNTVRVGYDDNVDQNSSGESASAYIKDIVNLAFRAALTDRTDLVFRSNFTFHSDDDRQKLDPNIYAILSHSVSPRLLLQLSEKYQSDYTTTANEDGRYDYFINTLSADPTYVLSSKDRLSAPLSYTTKQYESDVDTLDYDKYTAGATWKRDLVAQRTWAALSARQTAVDYYNRDSTYDSTLLMTQLSHTFNPQWHGSVAVGVSFDETSFEGRGSDGQNPYFNTTLTYEPSPRTRLSGEFSHEYSESDNSSYAGETATEIKLAAQHDLTAKIMGKISARYVDAQYDSVDNEIGSGGSDSERMDLEALLQYKLNRINFLELRVKHSEVTYGSDQGDYDQNMIDLGWRVEL